MEQSDKIPAGETCLKSGDGKHHFIDWRDTSHQGPDFCSACQLYDPNDPAWPLVATGPKVTALPLDPKDAEQGYSWPLKVEFEAPANNPVKWDDIPNKAPAIFPPGGGLGHDHDFVPPVVTELPEGAIPLIPMTEPEVIGQIPEEFMRQTTVPIPTDTLREYFTNKNLFFILNHSESKLKGAPFLTYLTNLNIPSDVTFNEPLSYEEYEEIMKAHFEQASIHNCARLHVMAAEILLMAKGLPYEQSPYALPIDPGHPFKFIHDNMELVASWVDFLDSTQVFALHSIKALADHFKPAEKFDVIDDKNAVGANVAMQFRLPNMIAAYFAVPNAEYKLSYYKQQFNEYMFKNDRLANHFGAKNNFAALMFGAFAQGIFTLTEMGGAPIFQIGVFDPKHKAYTAEPYVYSPAQD